MTHTFHLIRESIRTNGLRYTMRTAMEAGNTDAERIICAWINQCVTPTDWLAMRARWNAQGFESKAEVIRLTTTVRS